MPDVTETEQPNKAPEPKVYTAQEFLAAYESLCTTMGFKFITTPEFLPRDDNTFSIVTKTVIRPMPKNK